MATVAAASMCNIRSINMARKQPMKGPIQYTTTCSQAVVPLHPNVCPVAMAGLKYMPVRLMPAKIKNRMDIGLRVSRCHKVAFVLQIVSSEN